MREWLYSIVVGFGVTIVGICIAVIVIAIIAACPFLGMFGYFTKKRIKERKSEK